MRACAAALALATPAFASETVSRAQVLDAIRVFEANASGGIAPARPVAQANEAVAQASNTILKFALESDDVVVDLGSDSVPWCDVKKGISAMPDSGERGLLLAAYLAGEVKAQLLSGRQDANPYEGWVAMLRVYRVLKVREGVEVPEVEALLARQMRGSLASFAAEALARSAENLRKTYGAPGAKTSANALASQP